MADYTLSDSLKQAVHIAQAIAKEYAHSEYSSAHMLKALLHKDVGMLKFINNIGQDGYYVEEWSEVRLESFPKTTKIPENPGSDSFVEAAFYEADNIKLKMGLEEVSPECLLTALCTPGVGFSFEQLKTFPLTPSELMNHFGEKAGAVSSNGDTATSNGSPATLPSAVQYCIDKTAEAQNETLEKISGRDSEIKMITEILGRRSKPNVLILGDPGVGKTVMMNALAYAAISDTIPQHLKDARVFELDFIDLVSGAGYKGEIEDRFKKVFTQIKKLNKPILLIDELKNLTDKNSGNQGLANILKSELVKGELTVIGTATNDAYRKHIESDEGLSRQFEIVRLNEPSEEEALRMIKNNVNYYTDHHELEIDPETISEAIRLAKRYNKERALPDSALDLIDRTMSAANFMKETSVMEIMELKSRLDELKKQKLETEHILAEQNWMYSQMKDKLSYLLFTELGEDDHFESISDPKKGFKTLHSVLDNLKIIAEKEKNSISKMILHPRLRIRLVFLRENCNRTKKSDS